MNGQAWATIGQASDMGVLGAGGGLGGLGQAVMRVVQFKLC